MLQLIVLFAASWLLVWLIEKQHLSVLGLRPNTERIKYFVILFLAAATCSAAAFLLRMLLVKESYMLSPSLNVRAVVTEIGYQIRTVLTEELLFRGVLLYILIKKLGVKKAIVISSVAFALMHWMNAGVWGNITQMATVFLFTFFMGLVLAFAYAKTYSLLLPFAIHFGWNLVQNYIFPGMTGSNAVFVLAANPPVVTISYAAFFTMLLLPKIAVLVTSYFIMRQHLQVATP